MGKEILLRYDDGYPEGFSLLDNRDLWSGTGRDRKALLRPATLGVYVLMCSLPRDWIFREVWLTDRLGIGRDALRRIVRELVKAHRLRKDEIRDEKGRYVRTDWVLLRGGSPRTGKPSADIPATDRPATAKSTAGKAADLVNTKAATNTETTTTAPVDLNWIALPQFSTDDQAVVVEIVKELEPDQQQAVLDELAGALRAKAIKGQWPGWLHRIAQRASVGGFQPNHALAIQSERKLRADAEQRAKQQRAEAEARNARLSDPEAKARSQENLRAIGALLRP